MSQSAPTQGRWSRWGRVGFDKSIKVSDWASGYANAVSAKVGGERFWPKSNDMPLEIEKCERILRAFTVEGIPQKEEKEEEVKDGKGNWIKKKRKVLKKIPPQAIKRAKGVCIFSSMRSGIAPFGGAGGSGLVLARLPDGSWSAPSAISPNNLTAGLLLGLDFMDAVLLINTDKAMESFKTHKFTIGAETAVTAGPVGAGTSMEGGVERAPIFSYVRTRGMYAGAELMGQVFLDRFDENERFYYWPGIKAGDILTGKVRIPPVVYPLHRALRDAETGQAQGGKLERTVYDVVKMPDSDVMKALKGSEKAPKRFVAGAPGQAPITPEGSATPILNGNDGEEMETKDDDMVHDGERLRLPPTPQELEMLEAAGIPDDEDARFEREERIKVYQMPPPPMHPQVSSFWRARPELARKRRTTQIEIDGPYGVEVRQAQYVPLPASPTETLTAEDDLMVSNNLVPVLEEQAEEIHHDGIVDEDDDLMSTNQSTNELKTAGERDAIENGTLLEGVDEEEADAFMHAAQQDQDVEAVEEGIEQQIFTEGEEEVRQQDDEIDPMKGEGNAIGVDNDAEAVQQEVRDQLESSRPPSPVAGSSTDDQFQSVQKNEDQSQEAREENTLEEEGEKDKSEERQENGEVVTPSASSWRPSLDLSEAGSPEGGASGTLNTSSSIQDELSRSSSVSSLTPPTRPPRNRPPRSGKRKEKK